MGIPPKAKGGHRRPLGGAARNRTRLKSNANGLPEAAYSEGLRAQSTRNADHKPFDTISVTAGKLPLSYSSTTRAAAQ